MTERPAWAQDVDAETMFYCSEAAWGLFNENPDRFGEDSRAAMCLAKYAAQYFEQMNPGDSDYWQANDGARDYFGKIAAYSRILFIKCRKLDFIDVSSAEEVKAILRS